MSDPPQRRKEPSEPGWTAGRNAIISASEGGADGGIALAAHITKRFGSREVLHEATITVRRGTVHALVGENGAGKSTLVKIIAGVVPADSGELVLDGTTIDLAAWDRRTARAKHIGIVQQHGASAPTLTVVENAMLGVEPTRGPVLVLSDAAEGLMRCARRVGLSADPWARVETLALGAAQRAEVVAALFHGATILILDEPTAVLAPVEVEGLLTALRELAAAGTTIIIVTHKLDEVRSVADDVTVLRDGRTVATFRADGTASPGWATPSARPVAGAFPADDGPTDVTAATDRKALAGIRDRAVAAADAQRKSIEADDERTDVSADLERTEIATNLEGRIAADDERTTIDPLAPIVVPMATPSSSPNLERSGRRAGNSIAPPFGAANARGLDIGAIARAMVGEDVPTSKPGPPPPSSSPAVLEIDDLIVVRGELVGIAGVDGNGQRELAQGIAGLEDRKGKQRTVKLGGIDASGWSTAKRLAAGLAYVPEDRLHGGLVVDGTVAENLALGRKDITGKWRIDREAVRRHAVRRIAELDIRPADSDAIVRGLSGGNQQKVVIGRELSRPNLRAVVAAQPTRGVDLGAVARIHERLRAAASAGAGVLVISADLDELLALCHRIVVMLRGKFVGSLAGEALRAPDARARLGAMMTGAS